jgi:hypothetical protein
LARNPSELLKPDVENVASKVALVAQYPFDGVHVSAVRGDHDVDGGPTSP